MASQKIFGGEGHDEECPPPPSKKKKKIKKKYLDMSPGLSKENKLQQPM